MINTFHSDTLHSNPQLALLPYGAESVGIWTFSFFYTLSARKQIKGLRFQLIISGFIVPLAFELHREHLSFLSCFYSFDYLLEYGGLTSQVPQYSRLEVPNFLRDLLIGSSIINDFETWSTYPAVQLCPLLQARH